MNSIENSYRLFIKTHMSRMGIWPEQPKYVAIVWPLTTTAIVSTYVAPQVVVAISLVIRSKHLFYNYHMRQLVRLHDAWGDVKTGLNIVPQLLVTVICFTAIMNAMLQRDKVCPPYNFLTYILESLFMCLLEFLRMQGTLFGKPFFRLCLS